MEHDLPDSEQTLGPEQFSQIVDDYASALVLYARQLCTHPEDVAQEALLLLVEQRPVPTNIRAWLYRVTRNLALNYARRDHRRTQHESSVARQHKDWFEVASDAQLSGQEAAAALQQLSVEERETIVARVWGELTLEEIASLTQVSVTTVHRRYHRGLESLRQLLSGEMHRGEKSCPQKT